MREAMRVLEAEGLITVRRGSHGGVRVALPRDDVAARYLGLVLQYLFAVTLKDTALALPPSCRLSPGLVPTPFYEQWGLSGNGVLEFISNFEILNGVLQWNWGVVVDASQHLILPALAVGTIQLAIIARMTRSAITFALGTRNGVSSVSIPSSSALRGSSRL